ncbi:MAG: c-type cytochrome [Phycisphaerae bacterium]
MKVPKVKYEFQPWYGFNFRRNFPRPPFWIIAILMISVVASWIPLAWAVREMVRKDKLDPRIHIFQDMDNQAKYKAQSYSPLYEDQRSERQPVPGTISRGRIWGPSWAEYWQVGNRPADYYTYNNAHLHLGYQVGPDGDVLRDAEGNAVFYETFPEGLAVDTAAFLKLGEGLFNIHCASCHGADGVGNGPVHLQTLRGQDAGRNAGWVPPTNLVAGQPLERSVGHLHNTVNNGIRSMAGYGYKLPAEQRWAIVAYVRALQVSQNAPAELVAEATGESPAGQTPLAADSTTHEAPSARSN